MQVRQPLLLSLSLFLSEMDFKLIGGGGKCQPNLNPQFTECELSRACSPIKQISTFCSKACQLPLGSPYDNGAAF